MSFRLYESAWVLVEGSEQPAQVRKDKVNAGAFHVNAHQYDVDARPLSTSPGAPRIMAVLNLQAVRDAGLRITYDSDAPMDAQTTHRSRPGKA